MRIFFLELRRSLLARSSSVFFPSIELLLSLRQMCNNFLADDRVSCNYRTTRIARVTSREEETRGNRRRGVSNISKFSFDRKPRWQMKEKAKRKFEYVIKSVYNKCCCAWTVNRMDTWSFDINTRHIDNNKNNTDFKNFNLRKTFRHSYFLKFCIIHTVYIRIDKGNIVVSIFRCPK